MLRFLNVNFDLGSLASLFSGFGCFFISSFINYALIDQPTYFNLYMMIGFIVIGVVLIMFGLLRLSHKTNFVKAEATE